jgi:hypothetical protein
VIEAETLTHDYLRLLDQKKEVLLREATHVKMDNNGNWKIGRATSESISSPSSEGDSLKNKTMDGENKNRSTSLSRRQRNRRVNLNLV